VTELCLGRKRRDAEAEAEEASPQVLLRILRCKERVMGRD
jgi:hypothetical protein